jgi:hypothetical protein
MRTNQNGMTPNRRLRIPFLNKPKDHTPIRDCIVRAAERAGIEPAMLAIYMSHFFEAVSDQVTMKKVVRIPGFGAFGPKTRFRSVSSRFWGDGPCSYAAFVPSSAFKLDVKMRVRPALSPETDPMRRLARNNSYRQIDGTKSLDETFENIRRAITEHNYPARSRPQKII